MSQVFTTRQFRAGNSLAVRIPASMAFPQHTELFVTKEEGRIIVEPKEETLGDLPGLFAALKPHFTTERPEFVEAERDW